MSGKESLTPNPYTLRYTGTLKGFDKTVNKVMFSLPSRERKSGRHPASEVSITTFCFPVKFYQRMKEIISAASSFAFFSQNGLQPGLAHPQISPF